VAVFVEGEAGVVGDLPRMTVGIGDTDGHHVDARGIALTGGA